MTKRRIKASQVGKKSNCWKKKSCVKVEGKWKKTRKRMENSHPHPLLLPMSLPILTSHSSSHSHFPHILFPFSLLTPHSHFWLLHDSHVSSHYYSQLPFTFISKKGLRKGYFQPFLDMAETCIVMNWACKSGHFLKEIQSVRGPSIWPCGIFSRNPRLHA